MALRQQAVGLFAGAATSQFQQPAGCYLRAPPTAFERAPGRPSRKGKNYDTALSETEPQALGAGGLGASGPQFRPKLNLEFTARYNRRIERDRVRPPTGAILANLVQADS